MFATLEGLDALDARLVALPAQASAELEAKAQALASALVARVRDDKLSGQLLQAGSGTLKASIAAAVASAGSEVTASVGSVGVKYAAIQDYGGRTAAHQIVPQKDKALAFLVGGAARFASRVAHPGSNVPGRFYLESSLAEARDEIVGEFKSAVAEAWERT